MSNNIRWIPFKDLTQAHGVVLLIHKYKSHPRGIAMTGWLTEEGKIAGVWGGRDLTGINKPTHFAVIDWPDETRR